MPDLKRYLDVELTPRRAENLCSILIAETVQAANTLVGTEFEVPDWFFIFRGETKTQLQGRGLYTPKYQDHLEELREPRCEGIYGDGVIGLKIPRTLRKNGLVSLLDSTFHEIMHMIQDHYWNQKTKHWWPDKWIRQVIVERIVADYLPSIHSPEFLKTAGISPENFRTYSKRWLSKAGEDQKASRLFMYLVDAIANPGYVYGNRKDLLLTSIKSDTFRPMKQRFNKAVGAFQNREGVDGFRYLVNAPYARMAVYFLIGQKKQTRINGKPMSQYVREGYEQGYSSSNIEFVKGGRGVKANWDPRWDTFH